jgi:hypothetical protein
MFSEAANEKGSYLITSLKKEKSFLFHFECLIDMRIYEFRNYS